MIVWLSLKRRQLLFVKPVNSWCSSLTVELNLIVTEMLAVPSKLARNRNDSDLMVVIDKWEDNSYISSDVSVGQSNHSTDFSSLHFWLFAVIRWSLSNPVLQYSRYIS